MRLAFRGQILISVLKVSLGWGDDDGSGMGRARARVDSFEFQGGNLVLTAGRCLRVKLSLKIRQIDADSCRN